MKEKQNNEKTKKDVSTENDASLETPIIDDTPTFDEHTYGTVMVPIKLSKEDVEQSLKKAFLRRGKKANRIQIGILLVIGILYLFSFIKDPKHYFQGILAFVALGFALYAYIAPKRRVLKLTTEYMKKDRDLIFFINNHGFSVKENGEHTPMYFNEIKHCFEDKEQYNLFLQSGKILCIPKRFLSDEQKDTMSTILRTQLQDRYQYITEMPKF